MRQRQYLYTTRDLLMMAALAALGGVTSTYINTIGDFFQSILGVAGTTQWAAGLHVLWLTLAVGLLRKPGVGTVTGLLKGGVELLTGNTHGLLVVLVDVVAGLLVDLAFIPFKRKDSVLATSLAGGLSAASNVFVFQLFAAVPSDTLAFRVLFLVAGVTFLSGVFFAGVMSRGLLALMRRAGVVKDAPSITHKRNLYLLFPVVAIVIAGALTLYLKEVLRGTPTVYVGGAVNTAYDYPEAVDEIGAGVGAERESTQGIPLREVIDWAHPHSDASLVLIRATDGYAFFVSMAEIRTNDDLMLSSLGEGEKITYNIVGALNSKAWVRGVQSLIVIGETTIPITGALSKPQAFNPHDWQFDMDSIRLDVGDGAKKLQGVALGKVIASLVPETGAVHVIIQTPDDIVTLQIEDVLADDDLRLFTIVNEDAISYALAHMDGRVVANNVIHIEIE